MDVIDDLDVAANVATPHAVSGRRGGDVAGGDHPDRPYDFGLNFQQKLAGGKLLVAKQVSVRGDVSAVQAG